MGYTTLRETTFSSVPPVRTFESRTDDGRNSRVVPIIEARQQTNADLVVYDPVAIENMKERFPDLEYAEGAADALEDAHGAVVGTDRDEVVTLDDEFDATNRPIVVDGRRILEPTDDIVSEGRPAGPRRVVAVAGVVRARTQYDLGCGD